MSALLRTTQEKFPTLDEVENAVVVRQKTNMESRPLYPPSFPPWRISLHIFLVTNTLDDPTDTSASTLQDVVYFAEYIFGFIFFVEMVMKMCGFGLYLKPSGYFRVGWNVMDFLIVVSTLYGLVSRGLGTNLFGETGSSVLRIFRLLRPLRSISALTSLRILVQSILRSLPKLVDVFLLYLCFLVIVGVSGVQLFKGSLRQHCVRGANEIISPTQTCSLYDNGGLHCPFNSSCQLTGNPQNGKVSFDNILAATLAIFTVVTLEGWTSIMYDTMNATSGAAAIYFSCVVVFGSFFIFNLALVIISEAFEQNIAMIQNEVKEVHTALKEGSPRFKEKKSWLEETIDTSLERANALAKSEEPVIPYVLHSIVNTPQFHAFQVTSIVACVVLLSLSHNFMSDSMRDTLHVLNIIINVVFVIEIVLRILASNFLTFFRDLNNVFDFVVVALSFVVEVLDLRLNFSVLRAIRVFRLFQIATVLKGLNKWCRVIVRSVRSAAMLTALISLIVFVYALIGAQLFGGILCEVDGPRITVNGTTIATCTTRPRLHYDSLGWSLLTSFVLLSGEDWEVIMYQGMRSLGDGSAIYFVSFYFIGNYLMLNLFIAVLLHNRDSKTISKDVTPEVEDAPAWRLPSCTINIQPEVSMFILTQDSKLRSGLKMLEESKTFDGLVAVTIALSTLALCCDNPFTPPDTPLGTAVDNIDVFVSIVFICECFMKLLAYGVVLHESSYLRRSWWNVFDFIIAISCALSLAIPESRHIFVLPKLIRVLRPIRLVQRFHGLQVVVSCVVDSLPAIFNVLIISVILLIVFSIVGVQMFSGRFYACTETLWGDQTYSGLMITERVKCANYTWQSHPMNFDHIGHAFLTLFGIASLESWVVVMFLGMDAVSYDVAPVKNSNPFMAIYFVVFIIVMGFFVINLFIGVLIDSYYEERSKRKTTSGILLSNEQQEWVNLYKHAIRFVRPPVYASYAKGSIRDSIQEFTLHPLFDISIISLVVLNTVLMATEHADESSSFQLFQNVMNLIFVCVFFAEAWVRFVALGSLTYFEDRWNIFDLVVTIASFVTLILDFVYGVSALATPLRSMRVFRFLRVARTAQGIGILLRTLFMSLPSLANIAVLLLLMFLIFTVYGVQMFATVMRQDALDRDANFETFGTAILTLLRVATGENWNGIMYNLMVKSPQCDMQLGECGRIVATAAYFCLFVLFGQYIMLNLFIAVILDNFSQASKDADYIVQEDDITRFRTLWAEFDIPDRREIEARSLCMFLKRLGPPLCRRLGRVPFREVSRYVESLNVPVCRGYVLQQDVLDRLLRNLFGVVLPSETEDYLKKKSDERFRAKQRERKIEMDTTHTYEMEDHTQMNQVLAAMRIQSFMRARRAKSLLLRAIAKDRAIKSGDAADAWMQPLLLQRAASPNRTKEERGAKPSSYRNIAYHLI